MISKTLAQILRHVAVSKFNLTIRDDAFCNLDEVIGTEWLTRLNCTEEDVRSVVANSDKGRYEIKEEHFGSQGTAVTLIRAVQGHSIASLDEEKILRRLGNESRDLICIHGTYRKCLPGIFEAGGLLAGGTKGQEYRTHVHFASRAPGDKNQTSGMRHGAEIAIWIDMQKVIRDGIPFFMSSNDVILSQGINAKIDIKYFSRIQDIRTRCDIGIPRTQVEDEGQAGATNSEEARHSERTWWPWPEDEKEKRKCGEDFYCAIPGCGCKICTYQGCPVEGPHGCKECDDTWWSSTSQSQWHTPVPTLKSLEHRSESAGQSAHMEASTQQTPTRGK